MTGDTADGERTTSKETSVSLDSAVEARGSAREQNVEARGSAREQNSEWELVGSGPAMERVRHLIRKVGPSEGRVLIVGENGTGKELVADAIHARSMRAEKPFVKVNCAAIPAGLFESELFGHEKGSFTGAVGQRRGRFEQADKGTLFLDEIGDMPLAMQGKLLRVLQEGTFERVGSTTTLRADVRVLAATNRDLLELVTRGEFREDLLYRLNVVTIRMPALRERWEDIPELARVLMARACRKNGQRHVEIAQDAVDLLASFEFPGNVRELGNLIERLVIMCEGGRITREDVVRLRPPVPDSTSPMRPPARFVPGFTYRQLVLSAEREILIDAIRVFHGNKSAAARALGLERAHFNKKCRALGVVEHASSSAAAHSNRDGSAQPA